MNATLPPLVVRKVVLVRALTGPSEVHCRGGCGLLMLPVGPVGEMVVVDRGNPTGPPSLCQMQTWECWTCWRAVEVCWGPGIESQTFEVG